MSRRIALIAYFIVALPALACSSGDSSPPDVSSGPSGSPGSGDVVLTSDALPATSAWEQSAEVQADRIILPIAGSESAVPSVVPGKVLVGGRSDLPGTKNPDGFLVRVKSVDRQGENLVVMTEPATLHDAVVQGTFAIAPTGVDFSEAGDTAAQTEGSVSKKFHYELQPRDLYTFAEQVTGSSGLASVNGKVAIKEGHFDFTPTLSYEASVKKAFGIIPDGVDFKVTAEGDLDASLTVTADVIADAAGQLDASYEKVLGGKPVTVFQGTSKKLPNVKLGPLNIASSAELRIDVVCSLKNTGGQAHAEGGASVTGNAVANVAYDGDWSSSFDHTLTGTPSFTYNGSGRFNGDCRLDATMAIKLFSAVTADVTIGAYARLAASATDASGAEADVSCDLVAGAQGDFDGKLSVFGFKIAEKTINLFKLEWSPDACSDTTVEPAPTDPDGDRLCAGKTETDLYCGYELGASDENKNKRYECVEGQFFGVDVCSSCVRTATETICNP